MNFRRVELDLDTLVIPTDVYDEGNPFIVSDGVHRIEFCSDTGNEAYLAKIRELRDALTRYLSVHQGETIKVPARTIDDDWDIG